MFPAGRRIGNQPVACGGIIHFECTGFVRCAGLSPIRPEAEFQAVLMRELGNARDAVGELLLVRAPIADIAKPARVQMKHFQSEL